MRKVNNRIDSLILFKGPSYWLRIINIKIVKINVLRRELKVDEAAVRRIKHISPEFYVDSGAVISTKDNKILSLSGIRPGNRAVIDFIILNSGCQLIKGMTILK